jgi:type II secretory pathway component GspD/PulD (secretin)
LSNRVAIGIIVLVSAVALVGCGASRAYKRGFKEAQLGNWESAVEYFRQAVQEAPDRTDYKIFLERAMIEASNQRMDAARELEAKGDLESAIVAYRRVLEMNPGNREALEKANELEKTVRDRAEATRPRPPIEQMREKARRQTQQPLLNPTSREPINLRFTQASTQDILNFVGNASGINVTYEKDFRPAPFSIFLEGVTLEEALNQIMAANQLWYKVINERTILVIPDNTQKRQQYEDQVIRTFYVSHADPQELSQLVSQVTRVPGLAIQPTVAINKAANTITVRATRGMVEIIERIIEANDRPRAEVIIDVDILEVSRSRAKQYGLNLSNYAIGGIFSPEVSPSGGTASGGSTSGGSGTAGVVATPPFNLNTISQGVSLADFYMTVPTAIARFLATDSQTRQIAKPQLRGAEGQKLTLNLGDEIPVPSTVFTPLATGGSSFNPLTSFSYRPVGVNLEVTPRVTYDGDIILDLQIESSNLGESVTIAGNALPSFGSRKVTTRLRLREGESNLLAGLISERERKILQGFPGVMNLPFFKQFLSSNDNTNTQAELVMILTPRVLRTHELREDDLAPIYIGTQQNLSLTGAPPTIAGPEPAPAPTTPPAAPGATPAPSPGAAAPGMPVPPAAAAPGMPLPGTGAATGVPGVTPSTARPPEGTTTTPVLPAGSSPIPGTTMTPAQTTPPPVAAPEAAPAPAPVETPAPTPTPPPAPATPEPAVPAPTATPSTAAPAPAPPAPTAAQVVLTLPSNEFRVGAGPYTVPISIVGVSRLSVLSLTVTFNPAVVRVRSVQEGSFLRQGGVPVAFTQQVDAAAGRLDISMTRTGDMTGASGAGLLAAVLFEPVAPGTATLALSGVATSPQGQPVGLTMNAVSVIVR